jgi:hypothetical protein
MAASREEIGRWFDEGVTQGKRYLVVMCDTFDWEDYPTYYDTADGAKLAMRAPSQMQKVMECYDLAADKAQQMGTRRAMALNPYA